MYLDYRLVPQQPSRRFTKRPHVLTSIWKVTSTLPSGIVVVVAVVTAAGVVASVVVCCIGAGWVVPCGASRTPSNTRGNGNNIGRYMLRDLSISRPAPVPLTV